MKRRMIYAPLICMFMLTTGCLKAFDLDHSGAQPLLVVQGRISSLQGPYLVRITRSANQVNYRTVPGLAGIDSAEAVKDALVIISDDMGVRDTLVRPESVTIRRYHYTYDYPHFEFDSVLQDVNTFVYTSDRGYYQTTKIRGIPGHTYYLEVHTGGQKFEASAYMPPVAPLDSAALKDTIVDRFGTRAWLPLVWFREPQYEKNYYQLQFNDIAAYPYDYGTNIYDLHHFFRYHLADDRILSANVNGLGIRIPQSSHYLYPPGGVYESVIDSVPHFGYQIKLTSLTKGSFNYFSQVIAQFQDDGNVYKPTSASAKGNISGGALGLFYATDVSYKLIVP
jgi:hypothetical protein